MRALLTTVGLLALLGLPGTAAAHVGSPDVFYQGSAGPYPLLCVVRPPAVIPGVADIEISTTATDIERVRIVPLPLTGEGARFAPTPDVASRILDQPPSYSGHLWMMTAGAWQVRVLVEGRRGQGELAVPVPTLPQRRSGMQAALAGVLLLLLVFLLQGLISIAGAAAGQARLDPGMALDLLAQRRARVAKAVTALVLAAAVLGEARWWQAEATKNESFVYRPLAMQATVQGVELQLQLAAAPRRRPRANQDAYERLASQLAGGSNHERAVDDLLPDHDHLMHLFLLKMPAMEQLWHLHPMKSHEQPGAFTQTLPALPAGHYRLYADIVHSTGVPETLVSELELPGPLIGQPLAGDDASGTGPPLPESAVPSTSSPLKNGGQLVWLAEPGPLRAREPHWFRFRAQDSTGQPAKDLELYMGMLGHAAVVKHDGSVFAHLHPSGSVPMAMLSLTTPGTQGHAGHHAVAALPAEVSFPYGFPEPGRYRLFVQLKRAGTVETGVFDVKVEAATR